MSPIHQVFTPRISDSISARLLWVQEFQSTLLKQVYSYQVFGLFWLFWLSQVSTNSLTGHQCLVPVHHLESLSSYRFVSGFDLCVQQFEASRTAVHPAVRANKGRESSRGLRWNSRGRCRCWCLCWLVDPRLTQDPVQVGFCPVAFKMTSL